MAKSMFNVYGRKPNDGVRPIGLGGIDDCRPCGTTTPLSVGVHGYDYHWAAAFAVASLSGCAMRGNAFREWLRVDAGHVLTMSYLSRLADLDPQRRATAIATGKLASSTLIDDHCNGPAGSADAWWDYVGRMCGMPSFPVAGDTLGGTVIAGAMPTTPTTPTTLPVVDTTPTTLPVVDVTLVDDGDGPSALGNGPAFVDRLTTAGDRRLAEPAARGTVLCPHCGKHNPAGREKCANRKCRRPLHESG